MEEGQAGDEIAQSMRARCDDLSYRKWALYHGNSSSWCLRTFRCCADMKCSFENTTSCTRPYSDVMGIGWFQTLRATYATFAVIILCLYVWRMYLYHSRRGLQTKSLQRTFFVAGFYGSITYAIRAIDPMCYGGKLDCGFYLVLQESCNAAIFTCLIILAFNWWKVWRLMMGFESEEVSHKVLKKKRLDHRRNFLVFLFWSLYALIVTLEATNFHHTNGLCRGLKNVIMAFLILVFSLAYVYSTLKILRQGQDYVSVSFHKNRVHDLSKRLLVAVLLTCIALIYLLQLGVGLLVTMAEVDALHELKIMGMSAGTLVRGTEFMVMPPTKEGRITHLVVHFFPDAIVAMSILIALRIVWRIHDPSKSHVNEEGLLRQQLQAEEMQRIPGSEVAMDVPVCLSVSCSEMFMEDPTLCIDRPSLFAGFSSYITLSYQQSTMPIVGGLDSSTHTTENPLFADRHRNTVKTLRWKELSRTETKPPPPSFCLQLIVPRDIVRKGQGQLRLDIWRKGSKGTEKDENERAGWVQLPLQEVLLTVKRLNGTTAAGLGSLTKTIDVGAPKGRVIKAATMKICPQLLEPPHRVRSAIFVRSHSVTRLYQLASIKLPPGASRPKTTNLIQKLWHRNSSGRSGQVGKQVPLFVQEEIMESPYTIKIPILLLGMLIQEKKRALQDAGYDFSTLVKECAPPASATSLPHPSAPVVDTDVYASLPHPRQALSHQLGSASADSASLNTIAKKMDALNKTNSEVVLNGRTSKNGTTSVLHKTITTQQNGYSYSAVQAGTQATGRHNATAGVDIGQDTLFVSSEHFPAMRLRLVHIKTLGRAERHEKQRTCTAEEARLNDLAKLAIHSSADNGHASSDTKKSAKKKSDAQPQLPPPPPPPGSFITASKSPYIARSRSAEGETADGEALLPVEKVVKQILEYERLWQCYRKHKGKFKASRDKKKRDVQHIATNLHVQTMWVNEGDDVDWRYDIVTYGATAAHALKFKSEGIWQMAEDCRQLKRNGVTMEQIAMLRFQIELRTEIAFSQALSALVTSFTTMLTAKVLQQDPHYLTLLVKCGYLFQLESLLSTWGDELGMLGDMGAAFEKLNCVSFKLKAASSRLVMSDSDDDDDEEDFPLNADASDPRNLLLSPSRIYRERGGLVVELEMRHSASFLKLEMASSLSLLGRPIPVTAVVFSQGINEFQTMAQQVGDTKFQHVLNAANSQKLVRYLKCYVEYLKTRKETSNADLAKLLEAPLKAIYEVPELVEAAGQSQGKIEGCKLLVSIADLVRRIGGGRSTCCKSAKDRTSMSVTLEQSRVLKQEHSMPASLEKSALNTMRSVGVRVENAYKNIGKRKFAFNKLQKQTLPPEYRPPASVIGASTT